MLSEVELKKVKKNHIQIKVWNEHVQVLYCFIITQMKGHIHNTYPAYTNIKRHSKSFLHDETQIHCQVSKQSTWEFESKHLSTFMVEYCRCLLQKVPNVTWCPFSSIKTEIPWAISFYHWNNRDQQAVSAMH